MNRGEDFFRYLEMHGTEIGSFPGVFDQMRRGTLQGALVHEVFTPEECGEVIERIQTHTPPLLQTWFPEVFHSCFYGRNLNLSPPDLRPYFGEAEVFNRQLEAVFPAGRGFACQVARILSSLDGGRHFHAAPGPKAGQNYMGATIRCHDLGG